MATIKYKGIAVAQYLWLNTIAIQSIHTSLANHCKNFSSKLQHWIHMNRQSLLCINLFSTSTTVIHFNKTFIAEIT
jgi:hypothetical protein